LAKPRIILTLGDPNGIGPEIILKLFNLGALTSRYDLNVIGSSNVLDYYSKLLKIPSIAADKIIDLNSAVGFRVKPGSITKQAGKISGDAVKKAIKLCLRKKFDALVTLPISKEAINKAGYKYPGHTEMLDKLAGNGKAAMIMYSKDLTLSLITVHIPLNKVKKQVTAKRIIEKVIAANNSIVIDLGIKKPRIAMLGLNPHAGDGGELGSEEKKIIIPAIQKLQFAGFTIEGPFPADGFFASGSYKDFDMVMSMYHDQGLIPFKMLSKDRGVNYTAGLNIIRTSPNHGTAFKIAGKGQANPNSTIEAVKLAAKLIYRRNYA
jgi:4-hydroxythreonine-4-phosphate dehydrogenase